MEEEWKGGDAYPVGNGVSGGSSLAKSNTSKKRKKVSIVLEVKKTGEDIPTT